MPIPKHQPIIIPEYQTQSSTDLFSSDSSWSPMTITPNAMPTPKHVPIVIPEYESRSSADSFSSDSSSSTYETANSSLTTEPVVSPKPVRAPAPMYSNTRPQSRRSSPQQTLLGAIDENSGAILPDIPYSPGNKDNPVTKLHAYAAVFTPRKKPTLAAANPPPNEYATLVGPNGEKFTDLRINRKAADPKKNSVKKFMCFG